MTMIKGADGRLYAIDKNFDVSEAIQDAHVITSLTISSGGSADIQSSASIFIG